MFASDIINKNWLLLDTCSTHCVGCNPALFENIRNCSDEEVLHIETNGGSLVYDKIGISNFLGVSMHYNPGSIANVLSLSTVANIPGCRLTMDTEVEKAIVINMENGNELKFVECANGLYYYDTTNFNNKNTINHYSNFDNYNFFINSVVNNKKSYNKKDIAKANEARRMHHLLCWPSTQQFK